MEERTVSKWNTTETYLIAGNFWGRKPSWISQFYSHLQKFSPRNFRHITPIQFNIPWKFSLRNAPLLLIRENFLPLKVSCYMVHVYTLINSTFQYIQWHTQLSADALGKWRSLPGRSIWTSKLWTAITACSGFHPERNFWGRSGHGSDPSPN